MTKSDTIPKTKKEGKTMPETLQIKTKIGNIRIVAQEGNIIEVSFLPEDTILSKTETQNPVLQEAKKQLIEYIEGKRREFDLPLHPVGTAFRQKVWKELQKIPYGEVRTYQQIAIAIGNPKACRAVGMANHCNKIGIIIPCHRVIGKDGTLTGYAGGLDKKEVLLQLEKQYKETMKEW